MPRGRIHGATAMVQPVSDALLRVLGGRAAILHGDPCVLDRWLWVRRWLRGPGLRTLDAGSGNGGFAFYASRCGNPTTGLSLSPMEVATAERRARLLGMDDVGFRCCDLRELDAHATSLGMFDQILCLEVAEHIRDDAKLLRDLADLLRPGGRLLITTPDLAHRPLWTDTLSANEDGGHVRWGYTPDAMAQLITEAGLRVLAQERIAVSCPNGSRTSCVAHRRFTPWLAGRSSSRCGRSKYLTAR